MKHTHISRETHQNFDNKTVTLKNKYSLRTSILF